MTKKSGPAGERLLVVFRPVLSLALLEADPGHEFVIDGVAFRDSGYGDMTGFYDWLRGSSGRIVGLRYCPSHDAGALVLSRVRALRYVTVDDSVGSVYVFFWENRRFDQGASDDQAFGGNAVFVAASGGLAVSFETYFLTEDELRSIREAQADWLSVERQSPGATNANSRKSP